MNINDYTGLPYNFKTRNCWHHVRAVRADEGIDTPAFDVATPSGADAMFAEGFRDSRGLARVDDPQDFDAVLMGAQHEQPRRSRPLLSGGGRAGGFLNKLKDWYRGEF